MADTANSPDDEARIRDVWLTAPDRGVPVIYRRLKKKDEPAQRPLLKLPFRINNGEWLHTGHTRTRADWHPAPDSYWEIPASWFSDTVNRALTRHGSIYIIQPYRAHEKCAPACRAAVGHECNCSCMGEHHGQGDDGSWFDVSETFSVRWHGEALAIRLLVKRA